MRDLIRLLATLTAFLAAVPAFPQVYKWVDENGMTNYSGNPPIDVKAGTKLGTVAEKITVYTPDKALVQAMQARSQRTDTVLSDRIDRLERQLLAERQARQSAAAVQAGGAQAGYERCLSERRLDCDNYGGNPPHGPVVFASSRGQPRPFIPTVPLTGITAGNVATAIANARGSVNYTRGRGTASAIALRSVRSVSMSRGFFWR